MKRLALILIFIMTTLTGVLAQPGVHDSGRALTLPDSGTVRGGDTIISVLTCSPGAEIYELVGHTAIRVRGEGVDSVWNYGVFDFNAPNFVYRFVKGETDYLLFSYPFVWFLPEYAARGSAVREQDLNLTPGEMRRLYKMLQTEALPQNRVYRYNYVLDNCATRVRDRIDEALGAPVEYTDTAIYGSFREAMEAHHKNYPWYQTGIDLALGSGIDRPITFREEMFAPGRLSAGLAGARRPDGRPLVSGERMLAQARPDAVLPPTPWWLTPLTVAILLLIASVVITVLDTLRGRVCRWWYAIWFFLLGAGGCLVAFLVFVSVHEATSPNILIFWLNPLQWLMLPGLWWRKMRRWSLGVAIYDSVGLGILLLCWALQPQVAAPAITLSIASTVILAGGYAINAPFDSYNKDRTHPHGGVSPRIGKR